MRFARSALNLPPWSSVVLGDLRVNPYLLRLLIQQLLRRLCIALRNAGQAQPFRIMIAIVRARAAMWR